MMKYQMPTSDLEGDAISLNRITLYKPLLSRCFLRITGQRCEMMTNSKTPTSVSRGLVPFTRAAEPKRVAPTTYVSALIGASRSPL